MAHVQVVPVPKLTLPRTLRLTGTVTYNAFKTTPVFTAVGGPVQEILVAPGETVKAGQPLLTVNSPDYSLPVRLHESARRAPSSPTKNTSARRIFTNTTPSPSAIWNKPNRIARKAQADLQSAPTR